jgi:hypothetical protein
MVLQVKNEIIVDFFNIVHRCKNGNELYVILTHPLTQSREG